MKTIITLLCLQLSGILPAIQSAHAQLEGAPLHSIDCTQRGEIVQKQAIDTLKLALEQQDKKIKAEANTIQKQYVRGQITKEEAQRKLSDNAQKQSIAQQIKNFLHEHRYETTAITGILIAILYAYRMGAFTFLKSPMSIVDIGDPEIYEAWLKKNPEAAAKIESTEFKKFSDEFKNVTKQLLNSAVLVKNKETEIAKLESNAPKFYSGVDSYSINLHRLSHEDYVEKRRALYTILDGLNKNYTKIMADFTNNDKVQAWLVKSVVIEKNIQDTKNALVKLNKKINATYIKLDESSIEFKKTLNDYTDSKTKAMELYHYALYQDAKKARAKIKADSNYLQKEAEGLRVALTKHITQKNNLIKNAKMASDIAKRGGNIVKGIGALTAIAALGYIAYDSLISESSSLTATETLAINKADRAQKIQFLMMLPHIKPGQELCEAYSTNREALLYYERAAIQAFVTETLLQLNSKN